MKTKERDVLYCGVDEEKIKNSNPKLNKEVLGYHHLYLTERHEIYKKKELQKLPAPWTEDEVLKNYRFTNIRRELDRESKWLVKKVSTNNELSLEDKFYNTLLFRAYNNSTTMEILGFPRKDIKNIDLESFRQIIENFSNENPKYVWYSSAFNQGGLKYAYAFPYVTADKPYLNQPKLRTPVIFKDGSKGTLEYREARDLESTGEVIEIVGLEKNIPMRMLHMVKYHANDDLFGRVMSANNQQEVYDTLRSVHGLANFLSYQIFVDLTYIEEFPFSENEFVISGPGCSRGIEMLFDDKDGMTDDECMFWLRDNIKKVWEENDLRYYPEELFDHLPEYDRVYNVMMLENSFCELSKLTKAKQESGRPRNTYKSRESILSNQIKTPIEEW